jgi:GNAT superfamily N-acetyltransferase
MDVRACSERDLELLRLRWPTPDDVAGAHYAEQASGATFLVGWEADEPWGWALLQWRGCIGENARAAFPDCVELNHLQVRPQHQSRGTGMAILAAAEQWVGERGLTRLAVSVALTNPDAARLYRRLGYQPTGVIDACSYQWRDDQGSWHDETESAELLVKELRAGAPHVEQQPTVGYVRTEVITVGNLSDAMIADRPVRWPPAPGQAAGLSDWMAPELLEAWEIVARDLETPEAIMPFVAPSDWGDEELQACAGVWWEHGGGSGISVPRHQPLADRVVHLADQFQESEVEALWFAGRPAVWPHCPRHPNTHPLNARLHNGAAVWMCGESDIIARIGELFPR